MKAIGRLALLFSITVAAHAATLPGVRTQKLGGTAGFLSSLACDSQGTLYYTTTKGDLFRFANGSSTPIAHVNTDAVGDSGLLGMSLRDDATAIVHYTTPGQTYDVISAIDLHDGSETVIASFAADVELPSRGSSAEHHGGNPHVAPDGSIFFGIGDYGGRWVASQPDWNGGRIWRIFPDGRTHVYATGFRNPFDMTYDAAHDRLIITDNGTAVDDEIDVVHDGDWCGWPATAGNAPNIDGATPPVYVFPTIVAPTGIVALNDREPMLDHGYLLGAFVSKSIYYIPDADARPLAPITLFTDEKNMIIDVAQAPSGEIYFASGLAIYRLFAPMRGDCNGDGLVNATDLSALASMLPSSGNLTRFNAPAFGCDANADGLVDVRDLAALANLIYGRVRAARGH